MVKRKNLCGWMIGMTTAVLLSSCYPDEELNVPVQEPNVSIESDLDRYIEQNFTQQWGMAIRYRFVDNYLTPGQRTTPVRVELVRPMLDFLDNFWINPYLEVANGRDFFADHVPAEIVFLGGQIINADGNRVLGTADAGAQITITEVNMIDLEDFEWRDLQLQTIYHEFAHTVHQRYKLPNAFETIAASGYTGPGSWFVLSDGDALNRGFVSPYSTSSPNEDFAETVAFFLFDPEFDANFITTDPDCEDDDCVTINDGKTLISTKLAAISDHYQRVTGVNLESLRAAIQRRL